MAYTEQHKQWLARYREIRAKLKLDHPGHTRAWYKHHAKVRADMTR